MRRVLVPLVFLLSACVSTTEHEGPLGTSSAKIIYGVIDKPAKYDSTLLIQTAVSGTTAAGCTATLITPHVAITARHCVSEYSSGTGFGADYAPSNMYVWYGAEPYGAGDNRVVRIVHNGGTSIADNDFALVVLKDAVTRVSFSPIRLAKPPLKGETVAVAGYGVTETDTGAPELQLHKRFRREDLKISYVGPVPTYYIGAREIMFGESICQGDSGGPVYAQGTGALLAVTSRGGNGQREEPTKPWIGCVGTATYNYFTRVDGFADLIRKTVADVGEILWEEGAPKPTQPTAKLPESGTLGSYCSAANECVSRICVNWAGSTVCSQKCNEAAPCPMGFECAGEYCVRSAEPEPAPEEPAPAEPAGSAAPRATESGGCSMSHGDRSPAATIGLLALAVVLLRRRR